MKENQFMESDILGFTEEKSLWIADESPMFQVNVLLTKGKKNTQNMKEYLAMKGTECEARQKDVKYMEMEFKEQ